MNYYIQGNKDRAEEIKAAFEELGINVLDFGFADKTVAYCSIDECVQYLPYSINLMNILYSHPDYQELPLHVKSNPKFKVGDWLYHNTGGARPILVKGYSEQQGYKVECLGLTYYLQKCVVENEYHLWTIQDAEDGDVLVTEDYIFIFKHILHGGVHLYCHYDIDDEEFDSDIPDAVIGNIHDKGAHFQPATKEQRDQLFAKMKEAGYKWDADKKELKKIPKHYDIASFHAGMPVLVRNSDNGDWDYVVFSHLNRYSLFRFRACGDGYRQCIPYDGNEHLLGTNDMCDEMYINW